MTDSFEKYWCSCSTHISSKEEKDNHDDLTHQSRLQAVLDGPKFEANEAVVVETFGELVEGHIIRWEHSPPSYLVKIDGAIWRFAQHRVHPATYLCDQQAADRALKQIAEMGSWALTPNPNAAMERLNWITRLARAVCEHDHEEQRRLYDEIARITNE